MDIDSIIQKIVEKKLSTYEQERLTVLNAIMGNIDIMMNKSDEWFGKDIPEEYSRVIRSLFSLSAFLLEKKSNKFEVSKIDNHNEINLTDFMKQIIGELNNILDFGEMKISSQSAKNDLIIKFSEIVLKEAVYNIFFSVYPFMINNSLCIINLSESSINISAEFLFDNLSSSYPGASELKKNIYTYVQGNYEKLGIGIETAISSLRAAGSIVKVNELQYRDKFSLSIMFPLPDFYKDIESIRITEYKSHLNRYSGEIALTIHDPFLKLFITDILNEYGYSIKHVEYSDIVSCLQSETIKAIIIEFHESLMENMESLNVSSTRPFKRIMIFDEKDDKNGSCFKTFTSIIKPFNIDDIIEKIEYA